MNIIQTILSQEEGHKLPVDAKRILNYKIIMKELLNFQDGLNIDTLIKENKQTMEKYLHSLILSTFINVCKACFIIRIKGEREKITAIADYFMCAIYLQFMDNNASINHLQIGTKIAHHDFLEKIECDAFAKHLLMGINEYNMINDIKACSKEVVYCKSYFSFEKDESLKVELKYRCARNQWLRQPSHFLLLFEPHLRDLKIIWSRNRLAALAYLISQLLDLKIIKVHGDCGFWKAIEDHLYDFDGIQIKTSLSDVLAKIKKDKSAYKHQTDKVDVIISKMLLLEKS